MIETRGDDMIHTALNPYLQAMSGYEGSILTDAVICMSVINPQGKREGVVCGTTGPTFISMGLLEYGKYLLSLGYSEDVDDDE